MKRCLFTLFPTPDAMTLIQNKLRTEGRVKKWPLVRGPKHADTKGNTTPICSLIGALVSFQISSWYLKTETGSSSWRLCCKHFRRAFRRWSYMPFSLLINFNSKWKIYTCSWPYIWPIADIPTILQPIAWYCLYLGSISQKQIIWQYFIYWNIYLFIPAYIMNSN